MAANNDFQDWEPKTLKKKTNNVDPNSSKTSRSRAQMANDFDPENITKPVMSTQTMAQAIQSARTSKNLTQSQLDKACNLPKGTIQSYESNKAQYNAEHINKISRQLGVKLPRPKKPRANST